MAKQAVDYKAVIEDLERKRTLINSQFDAALAAIRQIMALQNQAIQPELPGVGITSPLGVYRGMSMTDAAIQHISSVGRPVPNIMLANELERGGYEHKSKNFPNTLNSVLWRRSKTVRDIRKSQRGWELVDRASTHGE